MTVVELIAILQTQPTNDDVAIHISERTALHQIKHGTEDTIWVDFVTVPSNEDGSWSSTFVIKPV